MKVSLCTTMHAISGPGDHAECLAAYGLRVPMLSDYLPLHAPREAMTERMAELCQRAQKWRAPRLRTIAETKGSIATSPEQRLHVAGPLADGGGRPCRPRPAPSG